jgi:hypothetical protein
MANEPSNETGRKPDFLIIGAAKSGTTSLLHQLNQHPQIFMPPAKHLNYFSGECGTAEFQGPPPHYFGRQAARTWEEYSREFKEGIGKAAVGEACNAYLFSTEAAGRIRRSLPEVRLIAVLRHPAERAYSRFLQLRRSGREPISNFADALQEEKWRIANHWWPDFYYLHAGLYYEQLARYFAVFPREQIRIYLHEDMLTEPRRMLVDIFRYLGVADDFIPNMDVRYSASGLPRSKGIDWTLKKLRAARPLAEKLLQQRHLDYVLRVASHAHAQNLVKPELTAETRSWMIERYREDTLRLQDLIGRDLSGWLR